MYFVKELLHHQKDIRGAFLHNAKAGFAQGDIVSSRQFGQRAFYYLEPSRNLEAVIILPLIDKDMTNAPVQGWEIRRMA